ncbi:MAG: hypothetical protein IPP53_11385 [Bacteroidetes bacterium]|nr:hypothetical protein [Bacteroidota bacterium]
MKEYRGNFEFENGNLMAYNHDEGRLTTKTGGSYNLEYYLKDQLFSNRIVFSDVNVNGSINAPSKYYKRNGLPHLDYNKLGSIPEHCKINNNI